ncbi:DUF3606 domain-containing protein [Sphingomonas antarctica]|uniref:DUF3606 domain-containing protein n=1 Tax=Sphingomonas antarctica TaxID=2040274 RepID=UPI0039ED139C
MSHSPPIPPGNVSPYPINEHLHAQVEPKVAPSAPELQEERGVLAELREQVSPTKVGAAVAVAAAGIAALVVGRRIARDISKKATPKADNQSKRGGRDPRTVAKNKGYEVSYFANKHRISLQQARDLIASIGNNRQQLNAAASKLDSQRRQRS